MKSSASELGLTQPLYSSPLPLKFASLNSLKPNKRQNNEQSNTQKHKRIPGRTKRQLRVQKTSLVRNETKTYIKWRSRHFVSGSSARKSRTARVISLEELDTMSKNNLLILRALVTHTFVFVYIREFGCYILFGACETKKNHCETTQDN